MIKSIRNMKINYKQYGNKNKQAIVLLHGWGQNISMMEPLGKHFSNNNVIIVDLPGFGESEEPTELLTIYDYADIIHELLNELNIKNPILIGHSFGGKITLVYASKYECNKIILLASPFRKEITNLSLKTRVLKKAKKIPIIKNLEEVAKKHIGSTDYKNASPMMRKIMVEHVNLDITNDLNKIKCPTLIIWGDNDTTVSIDEAYELEKLISDAGVVIIEGGTHYAYLEALNRVINIIKVFIGGNYEN